MLKPWKRCLSDHEQEEEQLGPDDDDEVTGKQRKEKYEYDAAMKQRLVEFYAENYCFYNKDVKALLPPWNVNFSTNFLADAIRGHTVFESRRKPFIYTDKMCRKS